ncbi:hypothetical protein Y032_0011g1488 [Ancylostoma ceylanicum]|uniref:Uncharacterized protein n=1 Tax=Ancylostoma ceylanicum TaxID=53326 RepID=A0A016VGU9_9BILA|nr:hypothetical protein Y032_0011g1488 [Ancylostoma ceylanicum]
MTLRHYPLGHPASSLSVNAVYVSAERKENFNGLAIGNKCYDSLEAGKDYIIGCKGSETQVDNCKFVKEYKNITVDEWMQLFKAKRVP